MKKVVVAGYSGHAYVVIDLLGLLQYDILGYLDISAKATNPFSLSFLGSEKDYALLEKIRTLGYSYVLGIGDNALRKQVDESLGSRGLVAETLIHPLSIVAKSVAIEPGSLVCAGAKLNPLVTVGRGTIVNTGAIIEHECTLGSHAHVAPGAVLAGSVQVCDNAFVGANATIKQGLKIGIGSVVGAGAVVLQNVPNGETWVGCPARKIKSSYAK